jgi:hypothetical protein
MKGRHSHAAHLVLLFFLADLQCIIRIAFRAHCFFLGGSLSQPVIGYKMDLKPMLCYVMVPPSHAAADVLAANQDQGLEPLVTENYGTGVSHQCEPSVHAVSSCHTACMPLGCLDVACSCGAQGAAQLW